MYTSHSPFQGAENQVTEMLQVQEGLGLVCGPEAAALGADGVQSARGPATML